MNRRQAIAILIHSPFYFHFTLRERFSLVLDFCAVFHSFEQPCHPRQEK